MCERDEMTENIQKKMDSGQKHPSIWGPGMSGNSRFLKTYQSDL